MLNLKIDDSWLEHIKDEFSRDYMQDLESFLIDRKKNDAIIYPCEDEIFSVFNETAFNDVKVVILGQDPYHGEGQAHGISFSVKKGNKVPPSLRNIYKELVDDINFKTPDHGYLIDWAKQGVFMLNNVLTVEKGAAGSHQKKGWEEFTSKVIQVLNEKKENLVFILWGGPAQKKASFVDEKKHLVLKGPHPSPLSVYRGFYGGKYFSKCNEYLKSCKKKPIDWQIRS